jgi:hypothetical protein
MAIEHPLVAAALVATSDPTLHAQVRASALALEQRLAAALASEREVARTELLAALVEIQREIGRLCSMSLIPGWSWADEAHRRLYQRAVTLFGDEAARIVPAPPERLTIPARGGGGPSLFRR